MPRPAPEETRRRAPSDRASETKTAKKQPLSTAVKKRRRRIRIWIGGVLAVLALTMGVVAGWGVYQYRRIDRVSVDLSAVEDLSPQNFLVVGSDTRDLEGDRGGDAGAIFGDSTERAPGGKRADTIIVARVDPGRSSIEMLSIPRDLWIESADGDGQRINATYGDGPQDLIDAIETNLGIPINHYVEVNFNGFKGLVDAVGGVPLYFDGPVHDSNTGLYVDRAGCHTLDGVQALAFARSRHLVYSNGVDWITDQTGDLGRISRQQVFLRHALGQISNLGLGDVDSMRVLTKVAVNNVTLDDSLGADDILGLSKSFSSYDSSAMVVHRLTTEPMRTDGGSDVLAVVASESQPVIDIFTGRAAPTDVDASTNLVVPEDVTVDILNGSNIDGLAGRTGDLLVEMGFTIGTATTGELTEETVVRYSKGSEAAALLVASRLTPTPEIKLAVGASLPSGTVEIVLAHSVKVIDPPDTGLLPGAPEPGASETTATTPGSGIEVPGGGVIDTGATGEGTATPEEPLGLIIGDPPPGTACG